MSTEFTSPAFNRRVQEVHDHVGHNSKSFRWLGLEEKTAPILQEGPNTAILAGSSTRGSMHAAACSSRNGTIGDEQDVPVSSRILQNFTPAPPSTSTERPGYSILQWPLRTRTANELSSVSSLSSLRSQSSNETRPNKRKRFPFRKSSEGSLRASRQSHKVHTEGTANLNAIAPQIVDHIALSNLTVDVAPLPANLKPAAAKRLGLVSGDGTGLHVSTPKSSISTQPAQTTSHLDPSTSTLETDDTMLSLSMYSMTFDRNMEHSDPSGPALAAQHSFYLSSSEDSDTEEDEEEEQFSSPRSCRSSNTSYNISGSVSGEPQKPYERLRDFSDPRTSGSFSSVLALSHRAHNSGSSFGSQRISVPSSPISRPNSFSRPFARPPSQNQTAPPSLNQRSSQGEFDQPHSLTSIREDSTHIVETLDESVKPSRATVKHTHSAAKKRIWPTSNVDQFRGHGGPRPVESRDKDQDPLPELINWPQPSKHLPPETKTRGIQKLTIPAESDRRSARPLSLAMTHQSEVLLSSRSAEVIILQIFENLDSFRDLFACARLNQGFYKVFKLHELRLMKNALRNMSPAQWELREASPKEIIPVYASSRSEYTPRTYIQFHKRDAYTLAALKSLMLNRCRKILRPETIQALSERETDRSKRIDDALWRIWTFCVIFGADKGQENSEKLQMSWLCGEMQTSRPKTARSDCSRSTSKFNSSSIPSPESFGRGNYGGLTVDELYDMIEAWKCIKDLMKGIFCPGSCARAKKYGVFEEPRKNSATTDLDRQSEESIFGEWVHYLATLGPSTIVDLAQYASVGNDDVFYMASDMGWTSSPRPETGKTRKSFLQGVLKSLHDEKIEEAKKVSLEEIRAKRKSRGLELAAELREEKARNMISRDTVPQYDQSIGLWLEWMARAEGIQVNAQKEASDRRPAPKQAEPQPRPATRERRTNSQLSLFPPQYIRGTPNATPRASPLTTPMRSRNPSRSSSISQPATLPTRPLPKPSSTPDTILYHGVEERSEPKQQMFSPRLSTCPET